MSSDKQEVLVYNFYAIFVFKITLLVIQKEEISSLLLIDILLIEKKLKI